MKGAALSRSRDDRSRISAPPMKARSPAPVSTTARRSLSPASERAFSASSPISARLTILSLPGWSTMRRATRPAAPRASTTRSTRGSATLDKLDLVAVGILDEGNDRGAELHRARWARDLDARLLQSLAGGVDIGDADGEMAEGGADRIGLLLIPIVGKLEHRAALFTAI